MKRKSFFRAAVFLSVTVVAIVMHLSAEAQVRIKRYDLDFGDQETMSREGTIVPLRRAIIEQYGLQPGALRDAVLSEVEVVAKTRFGLGSVTLIVGDREVMERTVDGRPEDFNRSDWRTFDRVSLYPSNYDTRGVWQLKLSGNFKLRRVVVKVEDHSYRRDQVVSLVCESRRLRYNSCPVDGRIIDVTLVRNLSETRCQEGVNWGYSREGLWVDQGCRGQFDVTIGQDGWDEDRRDDDESGRGGWGGRPPGGGPVPGGPVPGGPRPRRP